MLYIRKSDVTDKSELKFYKGILFQTVQEKFCGSFRIKGFSVTLNLCKAQNFQRCLKKASNSGIFFIRKI